MAVYYLYVLGDFIMNRFAVCVLGMCVVGTVYANPYVSAKIGISDFVVDANQYMYHTPDAYKSTIVDGRIDDINAAYRAAVGLRFCDFRIEAEYGYGNYAMSGNWALNTKNGVVGSYPPNLSYPSTYTLKSRVQTVMLNAYYDVFNFGWRYVNAMYTDLNRAVPFSHNSIYVMAGVGVAHINDRANVEINTAMAWGGSPLYESAESSVNRFAYAVGAGISFGLTPNMNLDLAYKYTNLGKYDVADTQRDYSMHEITFGARWEF